MAPDSRVIDISAQKTVDGRRGQEPHIQATVVAAREAWFAVITDNVWFDGDTVAGLEVRD